MTAPRTRLPSLSFPDETDSHSVAQPPKQGVGLQAQSVTKGRPGAIDPCPVKLPRHVRRGLLVKRVSGGSAQERVGDCTSKWKVRNWQFRDHVPLLKR